MKKWGEEKIRERAKRTINFEKTGSGGQFENES